MSLPNLRSRAALSKIESFPSALSGPLRPLLAGVLVAGVLAACGTVQTRAVGPSASAQPSVHPVTAQASELARGSDALGGAAREANDERIDALLSQLDDQTLAREAAALAPGDPLYNYAGRALLRRGMPAPRAFDREQWQFGSGIRPPADTDGYRPPVMLGVLLPLSGDMSAAAAPVRDGLLAGYYGEQRRRPEVTFYDTQGTPGGAVAAYDQASAEGNDFVLGPLGREEVGALFNRAALPVPVLALNRGVVRPPAGHAGFSLSPEDEGLAAADYLTDRGARRVLVVEGSDDSQRRAVAAFRERLTESGGVVTDVVGAATADLAPFAQREGGVDAVLLAIRGSAARELIPKLALAGLADIPRVATSQLLSGTGNAEQDQVLDGIAFPSEAWTNRGVRGLPPVTSAGQTLPTARGPAARLFAFGYDAWLLTAYLEHLATRLDAHVEGATGTLRLDGFGHVRRTPAWSTFISGHVVPLAGPGR
ncbi:penicillin-binding protein activator [Lysobacter sp. D1-1-M9]|uniref:penicillin-binding protein activator n=3 Tax=Novilysobacter longmucuonensis TaxID=3098603 RepID=UPI003983CF93